MNIEVFRAPAADVAPLRELYRREMNCQIVHDSFLRRGFSDPYLLRADGRVAGYGLVANKHYPETVFEFHVAPAFRSAAQPLFREFVVVSGAEAVMAQTNDRLLTLMLFDCATEITSDRILFADAFTSQLSSPGGSLRKVVGPEEDRPSTQEPAEEWMIECDGVSVATGGVLFHYNPPYGDLYMEVEEPHRRRGFGSYLIQELKRICYERGKLPAARCNADNVASRKTLERAGVLPCGRLLLGRVTP